MLHLLKPVHQGPVLNKRNHLNEKPVHFNEELLAATGEKSMQSNKDPVQPKINKITYNKIKVAAYPSQLNKEAIR